MEFTRTVFVKPEDISQGMRSHADLCPVALAVKRLLPDLKADVQVGIEEISISGVGLSGEPGDDRHATYNAVDVPEEVNDFVARFDSCGTVEPFSFTVTFRSDDDDDDDDDES